MRGVRISYCPRCAVALTPPVVLEPGDTITFNCCVFTLQLPAPEPKLAPDPYVPQPAEFDASDSQRPGEFPDQEAVARLKT